jgi:hypothetical protein
MVWCLMQQRDKYTFKLFGGTLLLEHFPEELKKKDRTFSQFSVSAEIRNPDLSNMKHPRTASSASQSLR